MSSYLTRHTFAQMWVWQATHLNDASFIPPDKYPLLHRAALAACDARGDGVEDGVVGDPESCRVDLAALQCKAEATASCLTAPQVEAARKIYQGPRNPRTGAEIYSPLYPGSELGWGQLAGGAQPLGIPVEFFKYYVLRDPAWDYRTRPINFDSDVTASDRPEIQAVNAVDPDLRRFFARGGKLLLIGGWNDTAVPPKVAVNYYNRVVASVGERAARDSMRFFMVPGMGHGPGTAGPINFNFDALSLIEQWKERAGAGPVDGGAVQDGKEVGTRLVPVSTTGRLRHRRIHRPPTSTAVTDGGPKRDCPETDPCPQPTDVTFYDSSPPARCCRSWTGADLPGRRAGLRGRTGAERGRRGHRRHHGREPGVQRDGLRARCAQEHSGRALGLPGRRCRRRRHRARQPRRLRPLPVAPASAGGRQQGGFVGDARGQDVGDPRRPESAGHPQGVPCRGGGGRGTCGQGQEAPGRAVHDGHDVDWT
jgi:hypothetical protein